MANFEERYLGDGVYASCDGYHIILDLRAQDRSRIALEPPVFDALVRYRDDLVTAAQAAREVQEKSVNEAEE
jgi:hypothetical protein